MSSGHVTNDGKQQKPENAKRREDQQAERYQPRPGANRSPSQGAHPEQAQDERQEQSPGMASNALTEVHPLLLSALTVHPPILPGRGT